MNFIRSIAAIMFFVAVFAVTSFAQTGGAPAAGGGMKVAIIDSGAFGDEKAGITKYVAAMKALNLKYKPRQDELVAMQNQLQKAAQEFDTLSKSTAPVDPNTINAKREAAQKLEVDIKRKTEDAQAAYQTDLARTAQPLFNDIGKAIQDYAKQKGYAMIFDAAKDQTGMLIYVDLQAADVTADFIKFYNARPAGTASTATAPK